MGEVQLTYQIADLVTRQCQSICQSMVAGDASYTDGECESLCGSCFAAERRQMRENAGGKSGGTLEYREDIDVVERELQEKILTGDRAIKECIVLDHQQVSIIPPGTNIWELTIERGLKRRAELVNELSKPGFQGFERELIAREISRIDAKIRRAQKNLGGASSAEEKTPGGKK